MIRREPWDRFDFDTQLVEECLSCLTCGYVSKVPSTVFGYHPQSISELTLLMHCFFQETFLHWSSLETGYYCFKDRKGLKSAAMTAKPTKR